MSEPITNVEAAVAEHGALPMPAGPSELDRLQSQATDAMSDAELLRKQCDTLRARIVELEQIIAEAPASYPLVGRARAAADGITRRIAPSQAFREDEFQLHHTYRVGRDLPELGGAK